jgi:hypothetical protein
MGVDAEIVFALSQEPTEKRLREIQYFLMERVDKDPFFCEMYKSGSDKEKEARMFLVPIAGDGRDYDQEGYIPFDGFDHGLPSNSVMIRLWGRYYGPGYERGDALNLMAIVLSLWSLPDVTQVFYGGDSGGASGEPFTREKAHEMIDYFCQVGNAPYRKAFDSGPGEKGSKPLCSFCHEPMIRNGIGRRFASFFCNGCGETMKLRDAEFDRWVSGELDVTTVPRFNGVAQVEDKSLF